MPSLKTLSKTKNNKKAEPVKSEMLKRLPIDSIGKNFIKRKDGRYIAIFSVNPINMSLLANEEEEKAVQAVREAVNTAPDRIGILISSERLNLNDYMQFLQGHIDNAEHAGQVERLDSMMDFIQDRSLQNEKVLRFYLTVESPFDKEEPALAELMTYSKLLDDILKAEGMFLKRLEQEQLYELLYNKLNPSTSLYETPDPSMSLSALCPSEIDTTNPFFYIVDGVYHKSFTIASFPTKVHSASWLSPLFELPINVDVSITMRATDKELIINEIDKSMRVIRQRKQEIGEKQASERKQLERREQDAELLLDELSNENENLFATTIVVTLRADSREELRNAEKTLRTRISSKQMRTKPLTRWAFEPLWYTLPLCYHGVMEKRIRYDLPAMTIGSMQPFNSSTLAGINGVVVGFNEQTHDFIIISEALRKRNPHTVVIADTRAGKSYWMFADILRKLDQGRIVIDIDPERERGNIEGNHIVFSLSSDRTLNPFHIRSTIADSQSERLDDSTKPGDYLRLKIERLKNFFRWIHPTMDSLELAALDEALVKVYANKGFTFESDTLPESFPTMSEFAAVLESLGGDIRNLLRSLKPYYGTGTYSRLFDGQTNWGFTQQAEYVTAGKTIEFRDQPNRYTRLDIHELTGGPAQAPLMELLLQDVWEFVKLDRSVDKEIYIDEMWIVADPENPQTLKFIFEMSKRGGKYGVKLTTATQNVGDFLRTKKDTNDAPGKAIINNSGVKIFLRLPKEEIDTISKFVELSAKEKKIIEKAEQGHGIILVGNQHAQLYTFMTDAELKVYDPKRWAIIHSREGA